MNAIMMYMSGNSLQIFSIMMVFMLFKGPIQGLINTNIMFAKFDTPTTHGRLYGVKAVYILMQLGLLALGIWKVNAMGLLPYVFTIGISEAVSTDSSLGQRDRIGLHGNRNGNLWSRLILLLGDTRISIERLQDMANWHQKFDFITIQTLKPWNKRVYYGLKTAKRVSI